MNTKELILKVSKEEFILKGFNNASLRNIAEKCHISATAIYRHFKDKEDLFQEVIKPLLDHFNNMTRYIEEKDNEFLKNDNISGMWDFEHEGNYQFKFLFCEYSDLVKLIVKERKTWFKSFVVNYEFEATMRYIAAMKKEGYKVKNFNTISFRVLLDSYLEAYLNILNMELGEEELVNICGEINDFYTLGFSNLLGF